MNVKPRYVAVKYMKLDVYFADFAATVAYNDNNSTISVLSAYSTKTDERISVTTEMFEQIEVAVKNIIQNV